MRGFNKKLDLPKIQDELQQIILGVAGDRLPSIPDDVPILDLGISSLELVDGMRQVFDRFGVLVSIRRVIEGQITLGSLALYIDQELNHKTPDKESKSTPWQVERQIPLAPSQQHVAFLSRYSNEAGAAFNEALVIQLHGTLHGLALHTAVEEASKRYESLRTALDPEKNALNIGTGEPLELLVSTITPGQLQARLVDIVSHPFEIGQRLFRVDLLRLSEHQHVLVLVGHTLVIEQQALKIILADIADLYRQFSNDLDATAPPLSFQWTDYLSMGETNEANTARNRAEQYWRDLLSGELPRLDLPTSYPRLSVKNYSGSRVALELDPAVLGMLRSFSNAEGINPDTAVLSACAIYLQRLANSDNLLIGVQSDSLYLDDSTPSIANTRTMLPLLTDINPGRNFRDQVFTIAKALSDANAHRHYSLFELIQLLNLPRDQSRSPLFTIAFRSINDQLMPEFEGLKSEYLLPPSSGARYDLELIVRNQENLTSLVCDFSSELFDPEIILVWLHGITTVLESALQNPRQTCGLLPVIPADESEKMIKDWNQTDTAFPLEDTVLDLISEQARDSGEALAVRFGDGILSYSQLIERTDQIALKLYQHGVKRGDRVGILMKRSLDLIPALLATWRVGALYVPLDIGFPRQRISFMITDADLKAVLTSHDVANLLEGSTSNLLFIEDVTEVGMVDLQPATGSDSAYIMYTSGSTGKPKGVEINHSALVNCLLALKEMQVFSRQSSMLALTTITFDVSTNELFTPLISGGHVEIGEDGLVADGFQIVERLKDTKPTHLQLTASTWKNVLRADWEGDLEMTLVSVGEALGRDLAEDLLPKCKTLWNFYGPTETTVYSSAYRVMSAPGKPMQIGRPLPNTQLYILDKNYQTVPLGAAGDLYIAGLGLAVGYWRQKDLTDQRFVDNPFKPGTRMYYTGDLARYLPDGSIICLGRTDDQVKIHGVRVELGEVESALREIQGIQDAVVVAWKDTSGDSQLVAHVILNVTGSLSAAQIRTQLRERLPGPMVPPYILFTENFPKTANGKLLRAALPSPSALTNYRQPEGEPLSTTTEQQVAHVWARVLNIDALLIDRDADFMDLGGHSLLMTSLVIEIRKLFNVNFNLREFFEASTIRKFAELIDERQKNSVSSNIQDPALTRTSDWARQRMAFLQREAQLPRYIVPGRGLTFQPVDEITSVFLTGATGFLGVYIVAELLKTTKADIYCLVRPRRGEDSKMRIAQQMKRYQVWGSGQAWQTTWKKRLHVVDGDVTLPRLGMNSQEYETLAREIDIIMHGAAHVNFIYPYEALRATNVLGIHEIIKFAFYGRIKPIHHLSTAAIWPMGTQYTYYEKDSIDHNGRLNLGYDEAKWVGEKCLLHAEERGLPVARYRPGEVGGNSLTGQCVTDHFIIACFKGFLQYGAFPDLDIEVDIAPVDYVARALVFMAFHRNVLGRAFHLTNPSRRRLRDGLAYLRGIGYQFDELSFVNLRDRLVKSPDFAANALFAYQAALEDMDDVSMQLPTYDTRETLRELDGSGIVCPPADEKLFGTYLRYLQSIEFIPQPDALSTRS